MYQIRLLKGRNESAEKKFSQIFGARSGERTIMFTRLDLRMAVVGCNPKSAEITFSSDDHQAVRKLAEALSLSFRGISVLLAQVEPKKWFSSIQVSEFRDGKLRNVLEGRGMTSSTVREAVESYRLHRELAE